MSQLENLKKEINQIKSRNRKVEADKAWETSLTRKCAIALITYILIGVYMYIIGTNKPWLNALIPTGAFMLSTSTLNLIKQVWLKHYQTN
jgi:hypothetical protein